MEIITWKNSFGKTRFLIRDSVCEQFRTGAPWDSTFAWVKDRAAAARFANRLEAQRSIDEHIDGKDTVLDRAKQVPDPEDVMYGIRYGIPAIPVTGDID
jgi:hypothetical protein